MMRQFALLMGLACAISGAAVRAEMVYDNSGGPYFSSSSAPRYALDDGEFDPSNPATPGISSAKVTDVQFGYVMNAGAALNFDADVDFWDTLTLADSNDPASFIQDVNSAHLGGFVLNVNAPAQRTTSFFQTSFVHLAAPVVFPDNDWAVSIKFTAHNSTALVPAGRVTPLFSGGGPTVGANRDFYFRDVNNDGHFSDATDPARTEMRNFTGGFADGVGSAFFLRMDDGTPPSFVPEPDSLALLALAALPLAGIRRRK